MPNPYEIRTEDTRILKLWDYVSDVATPDNELEFKFDIISDSVETVGFENTNGELAITARADADTFYVAIQVANNENIVSLDTLEVRTDPNFITSAELMAQIPEDFKLHQNYPNPFNPSTIIRYGVPQSSEVRLEVFDMLGRKVATLVNGERQRAGWHQVNFDASRLASGMYLYRIVAGKYVQTRKMMLIK
ncbi:T9SS type A sorting domain-containing protein [Gracilimonas sediminicola]|uniref:T9SS type A sorting domain-containing protein n=1 Tax=Gracilimonas sediminicola TaxID=2952158 RepID=UPI0038D4C368